MSQTVLEFASEVLKIDLFPVQRLVLKVAYGLPLDPSAKIEVRDALRRTSWTMSEPEYLRFLFLSGRSNVFDVEPGREFPEVGIVAGRRSGKTTLGLVLLAFEADRLSRACLESGAEHDPALHAVRVRMLCTDKDVASCAKSAFESLVRDAPGTPYARQTQSNGWWQDQVGLSFQTMMTQALRGLNAPFSVLDELAHASVGTDSLLQMVRPVSRWKVAALTTSGRHASFAPWWRSPAPDALRLRVPSWQMNPTIPPEFFAAEMRYDSFDVEYGAEI